MKKSEGSNAEKKVSETVSSGKPGSLSVPANVSVPVITVANDENSVSNHKALQEVAELHAKLQAALQQQVCWSGFWRLTFRLLYIMLKIPEIFVV